MIPWRVCVPIRARSKGALDRRLPRDPRLRLPPSSSSRDWYLTDSLGSRATLRFGSLRACSSDGGTFEPGSPDAEEPFGADDAEAPIGSSSLAAGAAIAMSQKLRSACLLRSSEGFFFFFFRRVRLPIIDMSSLNERRSAAARSAYSPDSRFWEPLPTAPARRSRSRSCNVVLSLSDEDGDDADADAEEMDAVVLEVTEYLSDAELLFSLEDADDASGAAPASSAADDVDVASSRHPRLPADAKPPLPPALLLGVARTSSAGERRERGVDDGGGVAVGVPRVRWEGARADEGGGRARAAPRSPSGALASCAQRQHALTRCVAGRPALPRRAPLRRPPIPRAAPPPRRPSKTTQPPTPPSYYLTMDDMLARRYAAAPILTGGLPPSFLARNGGGGDGAGDGDGDGDGAAGGGALPPLPFAVAQLILELACPTDVVLARFAFSCRVPICTALAVQARPLPARPHLRPPLLLPPSPLPSPPCHPPPPPAPARLTLPVRRRCSRSRTSASRASRPRSWAG